MGGAMGRPGGSHRKGESRRLLRRRRVGVARRIENACPNASVGEVGEGERSRQKNSPWRNQITPVKSAGGTWRRRQRRKRNVSGSCTRKRIRLQTTPRRLSRPRQRTP